MVAEHYFFNNFLLICCSLAKISMVAELKVGFFMQTRSCSLAKISMVAEHGKY